MWKKIFPIVLGLCMIFVLSACGTSDTEGESAPEETTVQADGPINYENDEGIVTFKGIRHVKEGFLADDETGEWKKVIVVEFDYTNKTDEPKQFQNSFRFKVFQNNVEITDGGMTYYNEEGPESLQTFYHEALKGGTLTVGQFFLTEDESDITIILYSNSGDTSGDVLAQMTTPVTEGAEESQDAAGKEEADAEDAVSEDMDAEDVDAMLQGLWSVNDGGFRFDKGDVAVIQNGTEQLNGEYTVNEEDSMIDAVVRTSDGNVKFHLPYEVDGKELHLYNNKGVELVHE